MRRFLVLLSAVGLLLAACGGDDDDGNADATGDTPIGESGQDVGDVDDDDDAPDAAEDPLVFTARLSADAEVPDPGDAGATARAEIVSSASGELCFDIEASGLDAPVTAAHIHEGVAGAAGPVVVTIGVNNDFNDGGALTIWDDVCVEVDDETVTQLTGRPQDFYVNVHTESFGGGALRGQLAPGTLADLELS